MPSPGKEKLAALLDHPVLFLDGWINDQLARTSTRTASLVLLSLSLSAMVGAGLILYFGGGSVKGVGAISSPTLLEHTTQSFGDKSPLESFYELRRDQSFMDSVQVLGIERMEEIYLEKFKSSNHD